MNLLQDGITDFIILGRIKIQPLKQNFPYSFLIISDHTHAWRD